MKFLSSPASTTLFSKAFICKSSYSYHFVTYDIPTDVSERLAVFSNSCVILYSCHTDVFFELVVNGLKNEQVHNYSDHLMASLTLEMIRAFTVKVTIGCHCHHIQFNKL